MHLPTVSMIQSDLDWITTEYIASNNKNFVQRRELKLQCVTLTLKGLWERCSQTFFVGSSYIQRWITTKNKITLAQAVHCVQQEVEMIRQDSDATGINRFTLHFHLKRLKSSSTSNISAPCGRKKVSTSNKKKQCVECWLTTPNLVFSFDVTTSWKLSHCSRLVWHSMRALNFNFKMEYRDARIFATSITTIKTALHSRVPQWRRPLDSRWPMVMSYVSILPPSKRLLAKKLHPSCI